MAKVKTARRRRLERVYARFLHLIGDYHAYDQNEHYKRDVARLNYLVRLARRAT